MASCKCWKARCCSEPETNSAFFVRSKLRGSARSANWGMYLWKTFTLSTNLAIISLTPRGGWKFLVALVVSGSTENPDVEKYAPGTPVLIPQVAVLLPVLKPAILTYSFHFLCSYKCRVTALKKTGCFRILPSSFFTFSFNLNAM